MTTRQSAESDDRFAGTAATLRHGLDTMCLTLNACHPATGCLPLPPLRLPTTDTDITGYAAEIDANLWDGRAWTAASESCTHLPPGGVHAVWEILAAWRSVLLASAAHVEGPPHPVGVACSEANLVARVDELDKLIWDHAEPNDGDDPFGPAIDRLTRAELLANGDLIEADPKLCCEAGYPTIHIALTRSAWADCIAWTSQDTERTGHSQDESSRLWDVLHMGKSAYRQAHGQARRTREAASAVFTVLRVPATGHRPHRANRVVLRLHFGPGDDGIPVVTIGLPGDD